MNRRWKIPFLLVLSLATFTLFLNGPDIVTSHEARVALPARAMAASGWPWAAKAALVPPVKLRPGMVRLAPEWDAEPIPVNPWLVPVMSGQIRLQKPPLPYWCAAVCFRLFGGFSEIALRFVPALLGALAVLLIFDLGRVLFGRRVGWLAALVWVSTYPLADEYRKAMADPYLAFFTLACVWGWVRAAGRGGHGLGGRGDIGTRGRGEVGRGDREETNSVAASAIGGPGFSGATPSESSFSASRRPRVSASEFQPASPRLSASAAFLLVFYLSFALALLAKGPPAFVDVLLPLVVFHVCSSGGFPRSKWAHAVGVGLLLAVALPWPVYVWKNVPNALELWRYESVGELTDNTENARPGWFYLPQLLYLALPWTAVMGLGVARQLVRAREGFDTWMRRRLAVKDKAVRQAFPVVGTAPGLEAVGLSVSHIRSPDGKHFFPIAWYVLMVVFFSCVHLKKNQYLLPMLPAQTLLIAQGFAVMVAGLHRRRFKGPPGALAWLQTIVGVAFAFAVAALVVKSGHAPAFLILLAVASAIISLVPLWAIFRGRFEAWTLLQTVAFAIIIIVFCRAYVTPTEDARSAKQVAAELLAISNQPGQTLLTQRLPEEVAVYLPLDVRYDRFAKHVLVILDDQHGMHSRESTSSQGSIPVPNFRGFVPRANVVEIRRVPLKSAPGDARWKVWELTVDRSVLADRVSADSHFAGS